VHQVSLLEQGGGRLRAGDSDPRDHRDRLPPLHRPHRRLGVVVDVGIFVGIFPGLTLFLCVIATSKWPNRERPPSGQIGTAPRIDIASCRSDLSTKPWTGHQVEKVSFFADGNVVEIDAQIFGHRAVISDNSSDLGEEVDR
jgi:hypothetical protein